MRTNQESAEKYRLAQAQRLIDWVYKHKAAMKKGKKSKEYKEAIREINNMLDKNGKIIPKF